MSGQIVTIKIRIGPYELEVKGPPAWADKQIEEFITKRKKEASQ